MPRRNFILNLPYRELSSSDAKKSFQNELFGTHNIIPDWITANTGKTHVFAYDNNNEIEALLKFDDNDSYFYVDFLVANRLVNSRTSGTKLILLLEGIGKELRYSKIELDSLEQKIPYYLGLEYTDTRITNIGYFGKMNKMYKMLS